MTAETENLIIVPRRHFGRIIGAAVVCIALAAIVRAFAVGQIEWDYVAEFLTVPAILTGLVNTIVMAILAMMMGISLCLVLVLFMV
jgi:polar amino acid transport system permease protein